MKYSFMSFSCPELNIDEILHIADVYGYDGFEPRVCAGHKHGIEPGASADILKDLKMKSEDSGIEICCVATSCKFSNPVDVNKNIDDAKRAIELAYDINSPALRVFGGAIPDGISRKQSFELIVDSLIKILDDAKDSGVTVCVETHDSWCDPKDIVNIMKEVDNASIKVNWDIMHPVLSTPCKMDEAFDILKPWINHVHIHDGILRDEKLIFKPIGMGDVDHKTAIKLLKDIKYNGFISGEWINWEPYDVHLSREIRAIKSFEE